MTVCNLMHILVALGGLVFGGLTTWFWFREKFNHLSQKCETAESDNVILWNSYTSLQSEFAQYKEQAEKWKQGGHPKRKTNSRRKPSNNRKRSSFT